ncbi:hypothetical protein NC652_033176 [Populus alba x Populus x berolinensis]|nr:hypothetical protein NC652_033176 [Populus alba x Populus x berolinensis]
MEIIAEFRRGLGKVQKPRRLERLGLNSWDKEDGTTRRLLRWGKMWAESWRTNLGSPPEIGVQENDHGWFAFKNCVWYLLVEDDASRFKVVAFA